jgi:hypothetical protein
MDQLVDLCCGVALGISETLGTCITMMSVDGEWYARFPAWRMVAPVPAKNRWVVSLSDTVPVDVVVGVK